jgi:hypothetical protein
MGAFRETSAFALSPSCSHGEDAPANVPNTILVGSRTNLGNPLHLRLQATPLVAITLTLRLLILQNWTVYQRGLTGTAAEWAVKKKKQHHSVSNLALNAIESHQRAIESSTGR